MQNDGAINLEAYFERIRYDGARAANVDVLHQICEAHTAAIPYENIDCLLGKPIALDARSIENKLIVEKRGGHCLEQNRLLFFALTALGYSVTPIGARVRLHWKQASAPPRTHMLLRVDIGAKIWLIDAGISALSLTSSICLIFNVEQTTRHESRRIILGDRGILHQAWHRDGWVDVYEFTLDELPMIDLEMINWWLNTNPQAVIKTMLNVGRSAPAGVRFLIRDKQFTIRSKFGCNDTKTIGSGSQLQSILEEYFGLAISADACTTVFEQCSRFERHTLFRAASS